LPAINNSTQLGPAVGEKVDLKAVLKELIKKEKNRSLN